MKKLLTLLLMSASLCLSATTLNTSHRQEECVLTASPPMDIAVDVAINYTSPIYLGSAVAVFNINPVAMDPIWIDLGLRPTNYLLKIPCINQHTKETMLKPPLTVNRFSNNRTAFRIQYQNCLFNKLNPVYRC